MNTLAMVFLISAAGLLASSYFYSRFIKFGQADKLKAGRWFNGVAIVLVLSFWLSIQKSWIPVSSVERHLLIVLILGFISWMATLYPSTRLISFVLNILLGLGLIGAIFIPANDQAFSLPTVWLWTHIVLMVFGEGFFVFGSAVALVYLLADLQLRRRQVSKLFSKITSLPALDQLMGEVISVGFILLTVGMLLGFVFARNFWEGQWYSDPKVVFCVITWAFYAIILGLRWGQKNIAIGRRGAWLVLVGLAAMLFLAWGVERIFSSRHPEYKSEESI